VHALGYRRPRHDLTHRQDGAAVAAAKQVLAWLQKKSLVASERPDLERGERLILIYVDECELHSHPYLAKVWRRRGQQLKIPAAGEDRKFVVLGGVDYATRHVLWQVSATKGEAAFTTFLDHLKTTLPPDEPVIVVLDHAGYHRSQHLRDWWRQATNRFQPYWLPASAPQLNLIERLWRYLKEKLSDHRWWNDLDHLIQATETVLGQRTVRFHPTDGSAFRLVENFRESA
jgi:hypothetical protein